MGSRITRAFGVTDRQRRVHPSAQNQVKVFIKAMSSSMFGFLIFGLGFLTAHSNEAHQHCLEYLAIAALSAVIINLTNQQLCVITGWAMVMTQSLFLGQNFRLMFSVGQFLTMYSVFTNLFNYYGQQSGFLKNAKPSGLIIVGAAVLGIGHCSSHFIKQMRAQATGSNVEEELNFGLRFVLCFLGVMVVALTVMGHVHIRSRRFIPITLRDQIKFIFSIKTVNKIQIVLLIVGLRSLMLNTQSLQKCTNGGYLIIILVFTFASVFSFLKLMEIGLSKFSDPNSVNIPNVITLILLSICIPSYLFELPYFITYPISVWLNFLVIMHITNKIENEQRINYVLAFIVAIVCEANNIQHIHNSDESYLQNCLVGGICIPVALLIPYVVKLFNSKDKYRQVQNGQSAADFEARS